MGELSVGRTFDSLLLHGKHNFLLEINNDQTAAMPATTFGGALSWIDAYPM